MARKKNSGSKTVTPQSSNGSLKAAAAAAAAAPAPPKMNHPHPDSMQFEYVGDSAYSIWRIFYTHVRGEGPCSDTKQCYAGWAMKRKWVEPTGNQKKGHWGNEESCSHSDACRVSYVVFLEIKKKYAGSSVAAQKQQAVEEMQAQR